LLQDHSRVREILDEKTRVHSPQVDSVAGEEHRRSELMPGFMMLATQRNAGQVTAAGAAGAEVMRIWRIAAADHAALRADEGFEVLIDLAHWFGEHQSPPK